MNPQEPEQDRWAELAQELGLDPEPDAPARLKSAAAPESRPVAASGGRREKAEAEPAPEDATSEVAPPRGRRRRASASEEEPTEMAEPESPGAPEEPVEEKPSRGRRGRRGRRSEGRSRRGQARDSEGGGESAAEREDTPDSGETPRRRRARGRSQSAEPRPEAAVEKEGEDEVVHRTAEEEADEESSDVSKLNVPSWQELIASLYRPER
jgi:hypothetical protein